MRSKNFVRALLSVLLFASMTPSSFAETRGAVTNLPIPRFVSMKALEANVRRGPSLTHRIDWVYKHRNMPLEITAEFGHWRRVRDMDGVGGWVHFTLLSGVRTVVITKDLTKLLSHPKDNALPTAELKAGVIARLQDCNPDWCELNADGYKGWAPKSNYWGVGVGEIRD
ncbi:SH3 domain-containing protein [Falsihalocynthiibacter sp. S25ZX9]|uniref:SH3 domain-containing protein n=1 Tax=Falsihalocynthiibacter sp. S25ZX9 TaxID=3240870 RepID=UPI00350EE0B5